METKHFAEITVTYKIPLEFMFDFEPNTPTVELIAKLKEVYDACVLKDRDYDPESELLDVVAYYIKSE